MAFEHVNVDADENRLLAERATFLGAQESTPSGKGLGLLNWTLATYIFGVGWLGITRDDFDWSSRMYPQNTVFVDAKAKSGGDGTKESPWKYSDWANRRKDLGPHKVVARGKFRDQAWTGIPSHVTVDLRGWGGSPEAEISRGTTIPQNSWTLYSGTTYYTSDLSIDWAQTSLQICVKETDTWVPYDVLCVTASAGAGSILIDSVDYTNNILNVVTPWPLQPKQPIAYTPGKKPEPVGPLKIGTAFIVKSITKAFSGGSGAQSITLALASDPGTTLKFSQADANALRNLSLYTNHSLYSPAAVPNKDTLKVGEASYDPDQKRIYVRLGSTLTANTEIVINTGTDIGIAISGSTDIHTIGGTFICCHKGVAFTDGATGCMAWAPTVYGAARAVMGNGSNGSVVDCGSRFLVTDRGRYSAGSESAADAGEENQEPQTDHLKFIVRRASTSIINYGDRQPLMLNPYCNRSSFEDFVIRGCGIFTTNGAELPANGAVPVTSTLGSTTDDSTSSIRIKRGYLYQCAGSVVKVNLGDVGEDPLLKVSIEDLLIDNRGQPESEFAPSTMFWSRTKGNMNIDEVTIVRPIILANAIGSLTDPKSGRKNAAALLYASAANNKNCYVSVVAPVVYIDGVDSEAPDATLFNIQNESGPTLENGPFVEVFNGIYCAPLVPYLWTASGKGAKGEKFGALNIIDRVPLPEPGLVPPYESGPYYNDTDVVFTELQMSQWAIEHVTSAGLVI
jgi:hypothetical protein